MKIDREKDEVLLWNEKLRTAIRAAYFAHLDGELKEDQWRDLYSLANESCGGIELLEELNALRRENKEMKRERL